MATKVEDNSDCSRPPIRLPSVTSLDPAVQPRRTPIPTRMDTMPQPDIVQPEPRATMRRGYPTPTSPNNPNGAPTK